MFPKHRILGDSSPKTFLTALAAQERRVLELREELEKAEGDLQKLKSQWAAQEAARKGNELQHLEQLLPLTVSPILTNEETAGSADSRLAKSTSPPIKALDHPSDPEADIERRRSCRSSMKPLQRKVFSGSRHARALSLLSPTARDSPLSDRASKPVQMTDASSTTVKSTDSVMRAIERSFRSGIPLDAVCRSEETGDAHDAILETGKQLAGEFRDGLRTFFEDLRQAALGEELLYKMPRCDRSERLIAQKLRAEDLLQPAKSFDAPKRLRKARSKPQTTSNISADSGGTLLFTPNSNPMDQTSTGRCRDSKNEGSHFQSTQVCSDSDSDGWDHWDPLVVT